jgi:hypothetical protein
MGHGQTIRTIRNLIKQHPASCSRSLVCSSLFNPRTNLCAEAIFFQEAPSMSTVSWQTTCPEQELTRTSISRWMEMMLERFSIVRTPRRIISITFLVSYATPSYISHYFAHLDCSVCTVGAEQYATYVRIKPHRRTWS